LKNTKKYLPEVGVAIFVPNTIAENGPSWSAVVAGRRLLPSEQEDALSLMVMKAKHSG
jgi:hypothetical protein